MPHTSIPYLHRPGKYVIGLALLGLLLIMPNPSHADTAFPHHAGLVVRYGDGSIVTRCVDLGDDGQASGEEALRASGLSITAEYSSMGAAVCKINNDGCNYPAEDCFCGCTLQPGTTCTYWSYWHLVNNQWQYSQFGTSNYTLHSGEVDGWSWGAGTTSSAVAPVVYTFDQICVTVATSTPTPTSTPGSVLMSTVVILTPEPTHAPTTPTATPSPVSSVPSTATSLAPTNTPIPSQTPIPTVVLANTATSEPAVASPTATGIEETATPMIIAVAAPVSVSAQFSTGKLYLPSVQQGGAPAEQASATTATAEPPTPTQPPDRTPAGLDATHSVPPTPTPGPTGGTSNANNLAGYVLFGVVTLGLAGTLIALRLRRH